MHSAGQRAKSEEPAVGRNGKSLDQKESARWVKNLNRAADMARRMPQTMSWKWGIGSRHL